MPSEAKHLLLLDNPGFLSSVFIRVKSVSKIIREDS